MQLQTVKNKLTRLKQQLRAANLNTPQAIIRQQDALHLCDQLDELFNDNELSHHQLLTQFKELLENRWHNVQGTYLCYTATPQSPATDICCDIANYLAEHNSDKALSYLMPSVKHALHPVMYDNMADYDIRKLIRSCILSDDKNYLIPVDLLATLSCRDGGDNLTKVLNEILQYPDVNNNARQLTPYEQQRLMNHSALTQKLVSSRQNFETAQQSDQSLGTLLGNLEQAFRRASRGNIEGATENEAGQSATEGLVTFRNHCNALANMELILTQQAPNPSEANHALQSNPRRVYLIKTTQSTYEIGFQDSEGQYQQQKLTRDEVTGSGYLIEALDHLTNDYFNGEPYTGTLLSKPQIGHIISRTQVSHAFDNDFFAEPFYRDHLVNPINRAFYAYDYCVAQEAEALKQLLEEQGTKLSRIKLDKTGQKTLLDQYINQFNEYYNELNDKINKDSYEGQDPLRLTMEQIHSIHPDYINNSDDVLFILEGLTPDEIETATSVFDQRMRRALTDISGLAVVLSGLNSPQIERFISSLNCLSNIRTLQDLTHLARFLPDDKAGSLLKMTGPQFIEDERDFQEILEVLNQNPQEKLIDSLVHQERLTSIIKGPFDLKNTLETLNDNLRSHFLEQVDEHIGLTSLIKNGVDLQNTLEGLNPNLQEQLLDKLAQQEHLTSIIKKPYDLTGTLKTLSGNLRDHCLEQVDEHIGLTSLIKNRVDLQNTLEALDQNWHKYLLDSLAHQKRLTSIIKNPYDLTGTLKTLSNNLRDPFLEQVDQHIGLTSLVKNGVDLPNTLEALDQNWKKYLLDSLVHQKRLTSIIKTSYHLQNTLRVLDQNWQKYLLDSLVHQERLTLIIKYPYDLVDTLKTLSNNLQGQFLKQVDKHIGLTLLIESSINLQNVLKLLARNGQEQLLDSLAKQRHLTTIIKNPLDLEVTHEFLSDNLRDRFLEQVDEHIGLTSLVKDVVDLRDTLEVLYPNAQEQLLDSLPRHRDLTSSLINDYHTLETILRALNRDQQGRFVDSLLKNGHLTSIIKNGDHLKFTLKILSQNQKKYLLDSIQQHKDLASLVKSSTDLNKILQVLYSNEQKYLLKSIEQSKGLASLVKNDLGLNKILQVLDQNQKIYCLSKLAQSYSEHQSQPHYTEAEPSLEFDIMVSNSTIPQTLYPEALSEFVKTAKCLNGDNFKLSSYSRTRPPQAAINWMEATVAKHFFQCWGQLIDTTDEQVDPSEIVQSELAELKNQLSHIRHQFNSCNDRTQEAASATSLQHYSLFITGNNHETNPLDELANWLESVLQDLPDKTNTASPQTSITP